MTRTHATITQGTMGDPDGWAVIVIHPDPAAARAAARTAERVIVGREAVTPAPDHTVPVAGEVPW